VRRRVIESTRGEIVEIPPRRRTDCMSDESHVYSSCFVRHARDTSAPRPGASSSAVTATECTSNSVP
jgi:hypothetical protein